MVMINGKKPEVIIEKLREPFSESLYEKNFDGFVSVNIQQYINRLDEIIGFFNYNIETVNTNVTKTAILKTVRITIKDDDGNVVKSVTGDGGASFVVPKESNKEKNPDNTNDTAFADAVKRACKRLGMGLDIYYLNHELSGKGRAAKKKQREITGNVEEFRLIFTEPLVAGSKNSYTAHVKDDEGNEYSLVIWEREIEILQSISHQGVSYFDILQTISKKNGKAKINGLYQLYGRGNWPQIVFKGVANGEEDR